MNSMNPSLHRRHRRVSLLYVLSSALLSLSSVSVSSVSSSWTTASASAVSAAALQFEQELPQTKNNNGALLQTAADATINTADGKRILATTTTAPLNIYLLVKDHFDDYRTKIENVAFQTLTEFATSSGETSDNYNSGGTTRPSRVYTYDDFFESLRSLSVDGIYGNSYHLDSHPYFPGKSPINPSKVEENKAFYISQDNPTDPNAMNYAIVNICAFLAQAMVESIQFDSCDEWNGMGGGGGDSENGGKLHKASDDLSGVNGRYYPMSNACGQFGKVYHQEHCEAANVVVTTTAADGSTTSSSSTVDMTCPLDIDLVAEATPHPRLDHLQNSIGLPPPLQCMPKKYESNYAGYWDGYDAKFVRDVAYPSVLGQVDVGGCCYWGRGAMRTSGLCNFGKLNYYLGRRAYLEKRNSRYPTIDFCRNPGAICDFIDPVGVAYVELKWIVPLFEWIDRVQSYVNSDSKWEYKAQLKLFVDGGFKDWQFIDAVSSVMTRGCDEYYCSTQTIHMLEERRKNFQVLITDVFNLGSSNAYPVTSPQPRYDYDHFERWLHSRRSRIEGSVFVSQNRAVKGNPYFSQSYKFSSFISSLRVTAKYGVSDNKFFFIGDVLRGKRGFTAGLVNLAAFFANVMVESIRDDSCDEVHWEMDASTGRYAISNSCGQNSRSYQDEVCPFWQTFLSCSADSSMSMEATIPATDKAPFLMEPAPPPFQCHPGNKAVGYWESSTQTLHNETEFPNSNNRTDLEGCCWWGRGALQTRGTCNMGRLNFHIGSRASRENRPSIYPGIDFCTNPEKICSHENTMEIRWVVGMFEWIDRVQNFYDSGTGFDYDDELYKFVDGGLLDDSFIENVNNIFVKGCHTSTCDSTTTTVEMNRVVYATERAENFQNILKLVFNLESAEKQPTAKPTTRPPTPPVITQSPTRVSIDNDGADSVGTERPTGSPFELSDVTQFNDGEEYRIVDDSSSFRDETLVVTRNTTLKLESGGYVVAPANNSWPAIRLSIGSKLIANSGYVNGSFAEGDYEGGGGEAIQLNNGQSSVATASLGEFYDGIYVFGGDAPGPGGVAGNALRVNGFGTKAIIYGGNFIGGIGGKYDGLSVYVLNSGSVHIYGGSFQGDMEVTGQGVIIFHGCFLKSGTRVKGLFPDETELSVVVKTTYGGEVVIIPDGEQECETAPSASPTKFPTISPQPTIPRNQGGGKQLLFSYGLLVTTMILLGIATS